MFCVRIAANASSSVGKVRYYMLVRVEILHGRSRRRQCQQSLDKLIALLIVVILCEVRAIVVQSLTTIRTIEVAFLRVSDSAIRAYLEASAGEHSVLAAV